MSFIRYCIRQFHGHKCRRCYSMTCLYLLNACWLISINLLYAHCNFVFEMQLVLVLLHVQSQHLGFGSSCAVPLPTILAVFVDHCAKKLEVDEQGVGRMVGDEIGELLRWITGWSRRRARPSDTPAGHWSKPSLTWGFPTVLLMFIAQKFDISGLVLIYPHPWHPWALPPSPGQGPPRPARRCDMRLFIWFYLHMHWSNFKVKVLLHRIRPYTSLHIPTECQDAGVQVGWYLDLCATLGGPSRAELSRVFDGLGGGQENTYDQ